ncbi:MAG: family metallopeptidase [Glaciihabitans sp.]|nr:family metallopeptidase [Glaciihabitans sp.]
MLRMLHLLLLTTLLPGAVGSPSSALRAEWAWPVRGSHQIVRPFIAPATPFSAGHRGIDITASGDVLAPADGVVHFAGVVVNRPVLSVAHVGGVLSSYEPVASSLRAGDPVTRGEVIGQVQPGHCSSSCLHFGVRINGEYVSPLLFLGGIVRPVLLPTVPGSRPLGRPSALASRPRPEMSIAPSSSARSGARVGAVVALLEALGRDMRIQLRRSEARMPEHLLDGAQVGAAIQQVGRGSVAQRMRPGGSGAGDLSEQARDELINRATVDAFAAGAEEERLVRIAEELVATTLPGDDGSLCRNTKGDDAFLRPLAGNPHGQSLKIDIGKIEADYLAHAKGGCVEQFDDRKVPRGDGVTVFGSSGETGQYSIDLVASENAGQVVVGFRRTESGTGIRLGRPGFRQPACETAGRRGPARKSRLCETCVRAVPEPVAKKFEVNSVGGVDAAGSREACEVGEVCAIRADGMRAKSTLGGQIDREVSHRAFEEHPIIVTQKRRWPRQACRDPHPLHSARGVPR